MLSTFDQTEYYDTDVNILYKLIPEEVYGPNRISECHLNSFDKTVSKKKDILAELTDIKKRAANELKLTAIINGEFSEINLKDGLCVLCGN